MWNNFMDYSSKISSIFLLAFVFFLNSCGGASFFPDAKDQPVSAEERVQKNIKEGRGLKFRTSLGGAEGGNFVFASSNPLWRATLEKLDFIPLANVDYAGGIVITDWYGDTENSEELKVAVRFLSNEIRSDALDVTVYKRKCKNVNTCQTSKIEGNINNEIKASILKRAAVLSEESKSKKND